MFTDRSRAEVWDQVRARGVRAFARFLTPAVFTEAARRTGCRIISSPLNPVNLVWLGLAAALDTSQSFASVLTATFKILADAPFNPLGAIAPGPQLPAPNNRAGRRAAKARSKHDPRRG